MSEEPRPYTLVAELTYRCPLRCVYCSNPTDWNRHADALTTDDWLRVFREAEALGVVQLNLTGGEPLLRDDLEQLVEGARRLDLYTNLITSGIPLTRARPVRSGSATQRVAMHEPRKRRAKRTAARRLLRRVRPTSAPARDNVPTHRS